MKVLDQHFQVVMFVVLSMIVVDKCPDGLVPWNLDHAVRTESWLGTLCCDLGQETLLSQCFST